MTRYYVNDREVEINSDFTAFDQLLKHIEDRHLDPSSVIREVRVDGRPLAPELFYDKDGEPEHAAGWEKIEIFTGTLAEIAVDSIAGAREYLVQIENAAPELAAKFQDFPEPEDFGSLGSLCEGFYFLSILLNKLAIGYQLKLDEIIVRGISVQEHMQKFVNVVTQLNDAQEKKEYLLIADTIEYEILPVVPVWTEIFEAVSQKISQSE